MLATIQPKTTRLVLGLTYTVGLIGICLHPTRKLFLALVPAQLLLTTGILLQTDRPFRPRKLFTWTVVAVLGFAAEVLGVAGGWLFGSYSYGLPLGVQLWHVPVMIGINWLLLVVCTTTTASRWAGGKILLIAVFSAVLLTAFDVLLEPAAQHLGFWKWSQGSVPLQNYIGWFATGLVLSLVFLLLVKPLDTIPQAQPFRATTGFVLLLQVLFFAVLDIFFYFFG